jgi:hypothetical protein
MYDGEVLNMNIYIGNLNGVIINLVGHKLT